jgi:hypothetical protein
MLLDFVSIKSSIEVMPSFSQYGWFFKVSFTFPESVKYPENHESQHSLVQFALMVKNIVQITIWDMMKPMM